MMNKTKINEAAKVADRIADHWNAASRALGDLWMNGYGVFEQPSEVRANLATAKSEIEKAQAIMRDFQGWPTNADYED